MRFRSAILALSLCLVCLPGLAAEKDKPSVSKHDRKAAEQEFKRALDLQKSGQVDQAVEAASHACELDPGNSEYLTTREMLRQQIVDQYLERGNHLAEAGDPEAAVAAFSQALAVDPQNAYLRQRLRDVMPSENPEKDHVLQLLASVDTINVTPARGRKSIHVQGDTRAVYTQIGKLFDVFVQFDPGMSNRPLRFDLDNVDFYTAMSLLGRMTKTFWAPVSSREIIVATDSADMRKNYERLVVRTFYVSNAVATTELTDVLNMLRTVFELRFISLEPNHNTITLRGPREDVEAAASLVDSLMDAKPEILLDVTEYEFDSDKLHAIGLNLPTDFQVFNVPSEIRRVLGKDAQPIIDQLNKTGTIDPSTIPPADLANLLGSPLLAPFLLFGKGLSLTGISIPAAGITGQLALNSSVATNLEHLQMRAIDGEAATFRVGTRFPILTSTFNTVAISTKGAAQVGSTPSFTYADLGLTLKTTPHYHSDGTIRLDIDFQIQGLGTVTFNDVPELTARSYKGNITVREGEPSVVAGMITDQEQRSTSGYPGLGQLPVLRTILNTNSSDRAHNEILIVVTPYVIRKPFHDKGSSAFWDLGH
jgi:type II secretory pathway component GspD/PulD (secretin)